MKVKVRDILKLILKRCVLSQFLKTSAEDDRTIGIGTQSILQFRSELQKS